MVSLTASRSPLYPSYKTLKSTRFPARAYLSWIVEPEPTEAGVEPEIAKAIAESLQTYKVLFLGGQAIDTPPSEWHLVSEHTFAVRLNAKISRLCVSSNPEVIQTLFNQVGFDWSQQAQLALLLDPDIDVTQIPARQLADLLAKEDLDEITGAMGYLRPGDDGDFAEIGFANEELLSRWQTALTHSQRQLRTEL